MPYDWIHDTNCKTVVYVRDTLRYTGRTKSGFELHYIRRSCHRKPLDNGYCWQHQPITESITFVHKDGDKDHMR